MVSNWPDHWDQLGEWNHSTLFTQDFIKDGIALHDLKPEEEVVFIKLDDYYNFERSWIGTAANFREYKYKGKPAIRFEVQDLDFVYCPKNLRDVTLGWHLNPLAAEHDGIDSDQPTHPPFFKDMATCGHIEFERNCFYLLRMLGIDTIHKIPMTDNRGKADGFFQYHSLSVIYDATLEEDFQGKKQAQIENYINQLKKEKVTFGTVSHSIKETQRQVWIITRGEAIRVLQEEDYIKVKEVPYTKLIGLFDHRMNSEVGLLEFADAMKGL